ncbi:MAG: PPOX class F420-dependent oxidoreductase [Chloroflexota bacterium]|nr:PPOX class F420-dependent oxidoreductase [Chloroflexota bacterium]
MTDSPPRMLTHAAMQELQRSRCVLLTTFKRDGSQVATPVWPFGFHGRLMASTRDKAPKLKRMRHDPHVLIATCTQRGKQTGPTYAARARILDSSEAAQAMRAKRRRWWILRFLEPLDRGTQQVPFEIYIPEGADQPSSSTTAGAAS